VSVNIDLESLSGSRLKESYKDFKISALDIPLRLLPKFVSSREVRPSPARQQHTSAATSSSLSPPPCSFFIFVGTQMIVTYVDDDLLIVRDIFGGPEILRRKPVDYYGAGRCVRPFSHPFRTPPLSPCRPSRLVSCSSFDASAAGTRTWSTATSRRHESAASAANSRQ